MSRIFVIVAAAGEGTRFGGDVAKQYALLEGRPMVERSVDRLREAMGAEHIVVALARDDREYERRVAPYPEVSPLRCGGTSRAETVHNALLQLAERCTSEDWIAVHDAARPCVPRDALARLKDDLEHDTVGGLLAIPVADTLKRADQDRHAPRAVATEERKGLWQAQTPQMFRFRIMEAAFADPAALGVTDEAQAVERLAANGRCANPRLVMGSTENIKVTYLHDLALASSILALQVRRSATT